MSVLDRKLRRDVLQARTALMAILLVLVTGIACFVGFSSAFVSLERARTAYYARCRMADFWVTARRAPLPAVERLADIPGVAEVQARIVFDAVVDLPGEARPLRGLVVSLPQTPRPVINNVIVRRGGFFTGDRLDEVIVNEAFARARHIVPGDTVALILNNRRQELLVVGTAISSEFVYLMSPGSLIPDAANYGVFYVQQRFAEEVLDFDGACNEVVGLLAPGYGARPQAVLDAVERQLEPYGVSAVIALQQQVSHRFLADEINGLKVSATAMPAIFLAVAALVMNIFMSRLAQQQRTTVGTLRALGVSTRSLSWHYAKFGVLVGVIGAALGTAGGWGLTSGMMVIYRQYYEFPRLEARVAPAVVVAAVAVAVACALLGTVQGIRSVIRLRPAEAMRPRPPAAGGAIWLERYRGLWRRLGFRWQMVARNVWRHKWRSTVSLAAAAFGSALMLVAFNFQDAIVYLIDFQFDKVLLSDIDLSLESERDGGAVLEAARMPGVDRAEPLFVVGCEFRNGHRSKKASIIGVEPGATLTIPRDARGREVAVPPSGLAMSRTLAGLLDVGLGDVVTVIPVRGRRDPVAVPVTRLTDSFLGLATYADAGWLRRLVGEVDAVSSLQLRVQHGIQPRLNLYRRIKETPAVQSVTDNEQARDSMVRALVDSMRISVTILVGFAAAIFFGSILTTSLVSLSERHREVATLRVLGYRSGQVGGVFLRESLLVNVAGAAAGLPLGVGLILLLIRQYDTEVYRIPLVLRPGAFAVTVVLAVGFTVLAHGLVQRAVNRLNWLEALNARE